MACPGGDKGENKFLTITSDYMLSVLPMHDAIGPWPLKIVDMPKSKNYFLVRQSPQYFAF